MGTSQQTERQGDITGGKEKRQPLFYLLFKEIDNMVCSICNTVRHSYKIQHSPL